MATLWRSGILIFFRLTVLPILILFLIRDATLTANLFLLIRDLIDSLRKEPQELTTWNIYKQIQFLSENKLNADIYEVELYKRLVKPLTLVAIDSFGHALYLWLK